MKPPIRNTAWAICARAILATLPLVFFAATGQAAPLIIYDDDVQNGWANYSFNGGSDFSNVAPVHSGAKSISYTPTTAPFNAVSFALPPLAGDTSTATYPVLHFWIHGGATGGQQLAIALGLGDDANGEAETQLAIGTLNNYVSGGVAANVWHEVTVPLTQLNPPYNGAYDRIDLFSTNGNQATVYIDDVDLRQAAAPPPANGLVVEEGVTVASMISDRITWIDSGNKTRKASLAHDNIGVFNGGGGAQVYGVAMREFRYERPGGAGTRTAGVTTYGNGGFGGFGYITDHSSRYAGCAGDDSPLGDYFQYASYERIFEGRHHAIFRYKQNYPRNCPTTNPVVAYRLPVTIDWVFSTGHDNPLWAVTYDVDQAFKVSDNSIAPINTFYDDSRAPYGELTIDDGSFTAIDGVAWGDRYKFTSTGTTPVTLSRPWTWNVLNTVPYVKVWIAAPTDSTMGIVQTQTNAQQDAGGARDAAVGRDITQLWNKTSVTLGGNGCNNNHNTNPPANHSFPCADDWPYQAIANSLDYERVFGDGTTTNARMTWKTQFGFIGQDTYPLGDGSGLTAHGYPKKSYSTYVVIGPHSTAPVETQVTQIETVQSVTFTNVVTGSVATSGPAGIARADAPVMYQPAGYNHVYGALAFNAAGNNLDVMINVGGVGALKKPLIIVGNYTGADPMVKLGGAILNADSDYFASLRAPASELWITLNSDLAGMNNHLEILGAGGGPPAIPTGVVATAVAPTQVDINWNVVAGATYEVERASSLAGGYMQVGTPNAPPFSDINAMANTAYLYRVRAVNGAMSAPSTPDLATTVIFTDPNLMNVVVQVTHLSELRTAVNAVAALANVGGAIFTDTNPANVKIKAVHVTELRDKLDQALMALGRAGGGYANAVAVDVLVKAVDFQEIRDRVQ